MVAHRSTTPRPTLTAPKKPVKQEKRFPNEAARREASRKFRATFKGSSYLYVSNVRTCTIFIKLETLIISIQLAGSVTALDVERVFRPNTVRSVRIHPYDGPMSGWNKASASSNEVIDKKYAVVLFINNIWAYKGLRERGRLLKGHPLKVRIH